MEKNKLIDFGVTKDIYEKIQKWGKDNKLQFQDIDFESIETSRVEKTINQPKIKLAPVKRLNVKISMGREDIKKALAPIFGEPKTSKKIDTQEKTIDSNKLTLKKFISREIPDDDDFDDNYDSEFENLKDANRTKYDINSLFNLFKASQSFDEKTSTVSDFQDFIIQKNEEATNVKESKYINLRQPKSFIRHPSLVGFMR